MTESAPTAKRVVTLVHGTFARDAAWVRESSKLVAALRQSDLGPLSVRTFKWSGRNSHHARLDAGRALARHIVAIGNEYPDASQHIIAHSHGGNIALYAMRDDRARAATRDIVLLATPLVVALPRDIAPSIKLFSYLIPLTLLSPLFTLVWIPSTLAVTLLNQKAARNAELAGMDWILLGVAACLCGLVGIAGSWWVYRLWRRLRNFVALRVRDVLLARQGEILERLALPDSLATPILNVSVVRDEAAAWLKGVAWAAAAIHRRWNPRAVALLLLLGGVLMTSGMVMAWLDETFAWWMLPLMILVGLLYVGAAMGFVLLVFALLVQLLMMVWPKFFRGHPLGFGEQGLYENWLSNIITTRKLDGAAHWTDLTFHAKGRGLRHSRVYEDDAIIRDVVDWMITNSKRA